MKIGVRMELAQSQADRNSVVAWCSLTLDERFAVHNVRLVRTKDKRMLVCMPSNRRRLPCVGCGAKGHEECLPEELGVPLNDAFCPRCGAKQPPPEVRVAKLQEESGDLNPRRHYDVCHPTTADMRREIERAVLDEYKRLTQPEPPRAA